MNGNGRKRPESVGRDVATVILAVGLVTALNLIVVAILYDAIENPDSAGISENATQILTGWGGGIIGILGVIFGYKAGTQRAHDDEAIAVEVAGQTENGDEVDEYDGEIVATTYEDVLTPDEVREAEGADPLPPDDLRDTDR